MIVIQEGNKESIVIEIDFHFCCKYNNDWKYVIQ